ncbi:MAG TPA: lipid IV(A) 3-deoxy-D-manno-octulosonic acid transferase [Rhodocyclaceae bacterium]|nr:lipid IV(A) 3-deoxy-D-manno-octulosonic acid transferase [Rhodocyclaceae bacterium]
MARLLYSLATLLLLPWAVVHLCLRSRRQPEYLQHVGERFACYPASPDTRPLIWIHAVSVGETRAAETLITVLKQRYPQHRFLLTHMTPTGRATTSKILEDCERRYLPYDTPWAAQRFLRRYRPQFGLIMETELWPNLIHACAGHAIPLLLVNARLSERSARGYARLGSLTRTALRELRGVIAQSEADAARLRALGAADVQICGNLKFDLQAPPALNVLAQHWRSHLGDCPVVLCASTREGEEDLILEAWHKARPNALLVIVPRHPQRFDEVENLVAKAGLSSQRRSESLPSADTQVWIGDSMGEMAAYYAFADIALIGGSLLDFGSQNLIEACAMGTPVLLGPSIYNFAEAAANALACGAAIAVSNAEDFVLKAGVLLNDEPRRAAMGLAGKEFTQAHRGATERTLQLIEQALK